MSAFEVFASGLIVFSAGLSAFLVWNGEKLKRIDREIEREQRQRDAHHHPAE